MQRGLTKSGDHHSGSGLIDTNTHLNLGLEYYRQHYPSHSQPPPLLHPHPDSLITESPLTNLYNGYISSSSSMHCGPSNKSGTGSQIPGPQGLSPHHSNSHSKKHRKNKKCTELFKQSPVKHPDHSKSQSGISRDFGLHGSNFAKYTANEFNIPAGTFFPNPLLNPRNEHFCEHRIASSQPPSFVQKHPEGIRLDSPPTNLHNEFVSSSNSLHCGHLKNDGTDNRNAGYRGYCPDPRFIPYNRYHKRKYQKP